MQTDRKILIAFSLNLFFSVFEFFGGIFTGSVAIISDAVHDFGDSVSILVSYYMEKISKKDPDNSHTYGYMRYSVLGSVITTVVLLFSSLTVIYNALPKIINPEPIKDKAVIVLAVFGVAANFAAAYYTHGKDSLNQRAVNLHMIEDVLGWIAVLVGSIIIKITGVYAIDPILSIVIAVFILINAIKNLKLVLDIFLEKTPDSINLDEIKEHISEIDGVLDVHHIHIRTIDGTLNFATMHIVTDGNPEEIKGKVKNELKEHGICHTTVEIERDGENCPDIICRTASDEHNEGCRHHHHHHTHHH